MLMMLMTTTAMPMMTLMMMMKTPLTTTLPACTSEQKINSNTPAPSLMDPCASLLIHQIMTQFFPTLLSTH